MGWIYLAIGCGGICLWAGGPLLRALLRAFIVRLIAIKFYWELAKAKRAIDKLERAVKACEKEWGAHEEDDKANGEHAKGSDSKTA